MLFRRVLGVEHPLPRITRPDGNPERLHCKDTTNFYKSRYYGRKNPLSATQEEVVQND